MEYKCLIYNKNSLIKFYEKVKEQFFNENSFSNHDNNELFPLSRKGVYPYQCMDGWEKFNKTLSSKKEDFYSHLNITNADYAHKKSLWEFQNKDFKQIL